MTFHLLTPTIDVNMFREVNKELLTGTGSQVTGPRDNQSGKVPELFPRSKSLDMLIILILRALKLNK